jgi:hypothetical protein
MSKIDSKVSVLSPREKTKMYAAPRAPPGFAAPVGLETQAPAGMGFPGQELQQQQQQQPVILGMRKPKAPPPTAPTRTLYIRNLNESMNHNRTDFRVSVGFFKKV